MSDQLIRWCCVDRLSWHRFSEPGLVLNWVDFHFPRRAFLGTWSFGFNGISSSGKFVVSKADEEYDARDTGPKRKFRFGPVCS